MKKIKAFTLAEILVTMGIIGVVAALTVPNLVSNYQNKTMAVKARKSVLEIEEAIDLLLTEEGKNSLTTSSLFGTNGIQNFAEKYLKTISNTDGFASEGYYPITTTAETKVNKFSCSNESYNGTPYVLADSTAICIVKKTSDIIIYMDINGAEPPNIGGRDMFSYIVNNDTTINKGVTNGCKNQALGGGCIGYLMEHNWKPIE